MKKAEVAVNGRPAGWLEEQEPGRVYRFVYYGDYLGQPVSLTMPIGGREYVFDRFPLFFEGVLPEGLMLESLLKKGKLDRGDLFGQLVMVGADLVGAVTVREIET